MASAPSLHRIQATFVGRPAHAGIAPESGRSAIDRRGAGDRADAARAASTPRRPPTSARSRAAPRPTSIAERCDHHRRGPQPRRAAAVGAAHGDARRHDLGGQRVRGRPRDPGRAGVHRLPRGRGRSPGGDGHVASSPRLGHTPRLVPSGGGSDVNAFIRNGFPAVNLCNGMIDVHTAGRAHRRGEPGADARRHARPDRRGPRRRERRRRAGLGPPIAHRADPRGHDRQPAPLRVPAPRRHRRDARGHGPPRRRRDRPGRGRPRADGAPAARGGRGVHPRAAGGQARPPRRGPARLRPRELAEEVGRDAADWRDARRLLHRARRSSPSSSTASSPPA